MLSDTIEQRAVQVMQEFGRLSSRVQMQVREPVVGW